MRQTTEQLPYVGSTAVRSHYSQNPVRRGMGRRHGFTLIEVVVAMAILFIVLIPLMDSFARGVAGFKSAELFTFAQNLAEFQAEDLKSMAPSVLSQLVEGKYPGVYMDDGITPDTSNPLVVYSNYKPALKAGDLDYNAVTDAAGAANDALYYMYDSGNIATDFNLIGLTKIGGNPYVAGPSLAPELPADVPMLGPNIEILPYEDVNYASTQWRYYRAVLHKEAYPLFSKRIQVTRYDAHYLPYKTQHPLAGDVSDLFDYTITVSARQSDGSLRVLYVTQGTIGSAFKSTPTTVSVTAPAGGASWNNPPATGTITWTVSSTAGVFAYNVRFSSDNGVTYGPPAAVVVASSLLTVSANVNPGIQDAQSMVMVEAVSAKGQVLGSDTSDAFTIGTPGGSVMVVQQPTEGSVWTTGQAQTVSWSTPAWMTVGQILVELSTDGPASYGPAVTLPGDATSTTLTPTIASANCVVRVTAQGAGGAPIVGGVATSKTFTTQIPLVITVNAPATSSMWTTNVAVGVAWSLNRSEGTITSYSITFLSGATGSLVTAPATSLTASIIPTSTSEYCVVRVTALNGSTVLAYGDSAAFKVRDPLAVIVTNPGTQKKNTNMTAYWTANRNDVPVAHYKVLLSVNNGATYVVQSTVGGGVYSATFGLPGVNSQCIVRVEALDAGSNILAYGLSGVFAITTSGH